MSNRHRFRLFRPVLRPSEGRRLPRELHARRVGRLARALADGLRDPGFEILLRRIDNAPILGGNEVEIYFKGHEAYAAMREAVVSAKKEILLESYIYKDDLAGREFLDQLSVASRRDVEVSVLADALGSFSTRNTFWQEMKRRGIHVRLYHPLFSSLWYQPFRDHRKILVVDRRVAFTGGMNIGEEYGSTSAGQGETWRDTHVRVEGPAAWEMAVVFSEGWVQAGGEPLELSPLPAEEAAAPGTRILVLDSRPNRGSAESASAMSAIVGAARKRVWLTNAYFAPGWAAVRILGDAAQRGVDVRLLLPGKTDVPIVRRAAHGYYDRLLARGVRIFEYQTSILHAKSLTADGYVSLVGSTNLDFRSFLFNSECDLLMLDEAVARRTEEAFDEDMMGSVEVHRTLWRRRPFLRKTGDSLARMLAPVL